MHDIMHYLPENPLPAVIQVIPSTAINSSAHLDALLHQLTSCSSVEHIQVDREWIDRLHTLLHFITQLSNTLLALLALAVVLIIGNTLRLGIQSRYEEIQVLKLIGATEPFIIRPFLYSGMWYGFAGAVIAIFLVNIFVLSLGIVINRLMDGYQMHYPLSGLTIRQILLLVLFSTILGWVAARFSVKKQLTAIEPAL
jgi:cell division transport system permease protein